MGIRAVPNDFDRPKALIDPTAADPNPNAFSDTQSHTHVSPILNNQSSLKLDIFEHIPVLKRMKILEEAKI